jgi:hypothetical protein
MPTGDAKMQDGSFFGDSIAALAVNRYNSFRYFAVRAPKLTSHVVSTQ